MRSVASMKSYIENRVSELGSLLLSRQWTMATAESCTGGGISQSLTSVTGSSRWFEGGVVSYSNRVKQKLLDVPADILSRYGAVSEPVALAMAKGARKRLGVDLSVSVTGIAGPDGGSKEKPVGTVWLAWYSPKGAVAKHFVFEGERDDIRLQSVEMAIEGCFRWLEEEKN
ncbi:Nicotinamide-nucleotide amidohydrolase PncC [invertebrate metagenome]|uniref:Nicotinamide-nucleotide amidohydrolase PncC n=1 Tax=invertebrate metagenome TaxID=1711999 RepID=A0A2H9TAY0_9ZZZZ